MRLSSIHKHLFGASVFLLTTNTLAKVVTPGALLDAYDYIIIGAGTAGSVVSARLSENSTVTVLVIEAGDLDKGEDFIRIPGLSGSQVPNGVLTTSYNWNYTTTPQAHANNRTFNIAAGKMVGGSSGIGDMLYPRGEKQNYVDWKNGFRAGSPQWGYTRFEDYFVRHERFHYPSEHYQDEVGGFDFWALAHGMEGPIHASWSDYSRQNISHIHSFFDAFEELGVKRSSDGSWYAKGAFMVGNTIDPETRTRSYARTGYFDPYIQRENFHALLSTVVSRVVFEEGQDGGKPRASGVEFLVGESTQTVKANREVIISAGAVGSPKILQLSGIGRRQLLEKHNITVIHDLPAVGANLKDHARISVTRPGSIPTVDLQLAREEYNLNRTGPLSGNSITFALLAPLAYYGNSLAVTTYATHPSSSGSIEIASSNPLDRPLINPAYLSNPEDMTQYINGIRYARRLMATKSFTDLNLHTGPENAPGADIPDEDEEALADYVRENLETMHDICGTCMMAEEGNGGVVGEDLKVHGVDGLRVIDASIIPVILGVQLMSTVYAIGEKGADLIKKDWGMCGPEVYCGYRW
ncbi:alcohol oxidase [Ascobolus immersus RN42]|uniref:Alcohol oxidase n=1 Tax=Ascobolus immersus RN42 TaxID=1160509 RepID=A0A3N4IFA5_ASCIM|nr:alcohol oxidase [Ascobolus immersus RN42]